MIKVLSKSTYLLIISIFLFVLIFVNSGFLVWQISIIRNDAKIMNYVGIIRGTIQRINKLELAAINSDKIIKKVDILLRDFIDRKEGLYLKTKHKKFNKKILSLFSYWKKLKKSIALYRKNPIYFHKQNLVKLSEKCWHVANETAFIAQHISEKKIRFFKYIIYAAIFSIIIILLIIGSIKKYVSNELEVIASYDPLTKTFNRNAFNILLNKQMKRSQRMNAPLSLIIFDVDSFKEINDTHGHKKGDYVLNTISQLINADLRETDFLCRIGGDEFAIIVVDSTIGKTFLIAERCRKTIEKYKFDEIKQITISLGISQYKKNEIFDDFYLRADNTLYKAKRKGKNREAI